MIVVWSTFTPLSAIISSKYRYLNVYFKYHLTFNKIISPTKCFHLKELDSISLPLISFLFYYILCRYFLQRNLEKGLFIISELFPNWRTNNANGYPEQKKARTAWMGLYL